MLNKSPKSTLKKKRLFDKISFLNKLFGKNHPKIIKIQPKVQLIPEQSNNDTHYQHFGRKKTRPDSLSIQVTSHRVISTMKPYISVSVTFLLFSASFPAPSQSRPQNSQISIFSPGGDSLIFQNGFKPFNPNESNQGGSDNVLQGKYTNF